MENNWLIYSLGDLIDVKHGFAFKGEYMRDDINHGPIVVAIGNFDYSGGFRFSETRTKRYTSEYPKDFTLQAGDMLLAMTCQTSGGEILGIPGIIPKDGHVYLHNQRLGKVIVKKPELVCLEYLYWVFLSQNFNQFIFQRATGTKILHTSPKRILEYQTHFPPLAEQKKIARQLWQLQNKTILNRQINQTLEHMTQALFKSWFVGFDPVIDNALDTGFFEQDLEFSDELLRCTEARKAVRESADFKPLPEDIRQLFPAAFEECSEPSLGLGGWVPEGWGVVVSGEEIDVRDGTHDSPKQSDHGYPLVTSKNLTSGRLDLAGTYLISPKDYEEVNKRSNVNKGDILITMIGTLGIPCLVSTNDVNFAIKNIGLFRTSETPKLKNYFFELLKSKGMQQFLDSRSAGTTQKYLSLKVLRNIFFIIPCCKILTEFNKQAHSIENKIQQNDEQNAELAKLRDTLLPKLISGELRLSDSEVDTAEEVLA